MSIPAFALPATPTPPGAKPATAGVNPLSSVGSFRNTALSGLLNQQGSAVAPAGTPQGILAGQSPAAVAVNPQSAVQKSAVSVLDQIKAGSQRQAALYKQAAANRVRSQGAGNVGNVGGGGAINYTPNGALGAGRNRVLALASSYVGRTPYVFGGTSYSGIDCSGLVKAVYASAGYNLPHSAAAEGRIMGQKTSIANLRPGDIVAWNDGSHIAIYAGNGQIIEAAHPGSNVRVHNIWSNAVYGIRVSLPGD